MSAVLRAARITGPFIIKGPARPSVHPAMFVRCHPSSCQLRDGNPRKREKEEKKEKKREREMNTADTAPMPWPTHRLAFFEMLKCYQTISWKPGPANLMQSPCLQPATCYLLPQVHMQASACKPAWKYKADTSYSCCDASNRRY